VGMMSEEVGPEVLKESQYITENNNAEGNFSNEIFTL
jgi:hypothetical protein